MTTNAALDLAKAREIWGFGDKGFPTHVQGLHFLLWTRRMAQDQLRLNQSELARELRLHQSNISRMVSRLVSEGRLTRNTRYVYTVADPAQWG